MKTKLLLIALLITIASFGQNCPDGKTCAQKDTEIQNLVQQHKYDYITYDRTIEYLNNALNKKGFKSENKNESKFSEVTETEITFEKSINITPINFDDIATSDDIKYDGPSNHIVLKVKGTEHHLDLVDDNGTMITDAAGITRIVNALKHLKDILAKNNDTKTIEKANTLFN